MSEGYNENLWMEYTSLLAYKSKSFAFRPFIVIAEIDDTLIKTISKKKIYENNIELYGPIKKFRSDDFSLIILSNQVNNTHANYDIIKLKLRNFIEASNIPVLAVFALRPNCFMKPHTKMWSFYVKKCYDSRGIAIKEAVVVSNCGGYVEEIVDKKNDKIVSKRVTDDTDLAFAHNIGARFISVDVFLDLSSHSKPSQWSSHIIAPEFRKDYIAANNAHPNYDVFRAIQQLQKADRYLIMIMGAPTSGKSTLARDIVAKWRASQWGETNAIKYFGTNKYSEKKLQTLTDKYMKERFSVLLDGEFPNNQHRRPFLALAAQYGASYLIIEVNPGIEMCKLFNRVRVETSTDLTEMVPLMKYYEYRGKYIRPNLHIFTKAANEDYVADPVGTAAATSLGAAARTSSFSGITAAYMLYRPAIVTKTVGDVNDGDIGSINANADPSSVEILNTYRF